MTKTNAKTDAKANVKTNVLRLLESRGIAHEAFTFPDSIHSAEGAAEAMGVPASEVYKTLVVLPERGRPLLVLVPGGHELDLRRLAAALGEKKLRMATQREAEALTGLQVGGISALALLNRGFRVCVDSSALQLEQLYVSGGRRGLDVRLAVADLIRLTGARVVDAATPARGSGDDRTSVRGGETLLDSSSSVGV
jgi:Cys-tRNA(Pro)/Cys-tRNA(Cys) deacylase